MTLIFTFGINPEQLTQYLDYAFYGVIGFVALGFIFGFIRGIWHEGFRLIFVGGLVIASILFTRQLVDAFMEYDVSALAASAGYGSLSLNLNATPIIVAVTTPYETVYELLEQSLLAFGFFITPAIADLIIGLTLVLLRYLLFIVLAIIIFILGETLAALLYFIPFRFIVPRNIRKKVKLRLLGGLAGALKMVLVLTMFLSPFTSLVNTVSNSFRDFDEEYGDQIDNELYNEIMSFVDTYNDSTFAQTLFSWSLTDDGLSIDTALMDFVTGQDLEDYRLTLANEIGSFTDIAATLLSSGVVDSTFSAIDTSLLITDDALTNLITSLTGSVLVMEILPIAITIGLNLEAAASFIDPSLIDLEGLNWEDELFAIGDIFAGVIRSGILTPILEGTTDTNLLIEALLSPTAAPEITQILSTIDESAFLSQVIPAVLYTLVQNELETGIPAGSLGLSSFLPTVWDDYQTIQFGSELSLIYELVYELNQEVDGIFDLILPSNPGPSGRKAVDEPTPSLIDLLAENFDVFVEILIGETDEEGHPINNDPITGKAINRRSLLDSDLIISGLPVIVEDILLPTLTSVAGANFDDTELNALIDGFNDGTSGDVRIDYKGEFAGLLSITGAVLSNETLIGLIEPEPGQSLDILGLLEDGDFRNGLKEDLIPALDRSSIILTIVPGILESTLTGAGFDDFLSLISLSTADLNFDFDSLSRELNIVVDMMGYAFNVIEASTDLMNQFPTIAYDLIGLLDNIYLSDIINLNPITENKSTNYNQIIKGIFSLVEGIGIEDADIDTGFNAVSPSGLENGWTTTYVDTNANGKLDDTDTISFGGENYHLMNFLKTALESGLLDISGDLFDALNDLTTGSEDIDDPNVATLYKIFAYADRSEIISNSFGGILDNLFGSTGGLLDAELGTSFRNVVSWTEEGSSLMYLVKQLTNFTGGLENIDFLNSDVALIEELLQGLAASQIFVSNDGTYLFPDFLLNQLTGISELATYFNDPSPYQVTWDSDPTDAFTIVTDDFYAVGNTSLTKENWYGVKTVITDVNQDPILNSDGDLQYEYLGGELEYIVGFISELQNISIDDLTSGTGIEGSTISNLLLALNDANSLRVLIYNIYDSIFGGSNFDIGSLSMSDTNTFVFLDLNQTQRAEQIEATADLLDTIGDMGLDGGGSFDIANFTESTILSVGDLLTTLHDAALFNSFKVGKSRTNEDLTVFEQTYQFLLTTATLDTFIYDSAFTESQREEALYDDMTSLQNNFGDGTADDWAGVDGEIQKFVDIMVAFVNTEIDFANFGGDAIGDLLNTEPGLNKVEDLLLSMNDSQLVSPAIGNLFGNIFNSDAFNIGGLTMSDANTDYFNNEPDAQARSTEISGILDIYWDINNIGLSGGASFSADLINPVLFEQLLSNMHNSNVFNTFKTGNSYVTDDLTIFEQTIRMILNTSTLDTFVYDGETNATRLSLLQDDISVITNNFADESINDEWIGNDGQISRIVEILDAFKNLELDFASFSGSGSSDALANLIDTPAGLVKIENLLLAMNDSQIVYPSIPNLFSNMLSAGDFSSVGVDFSLANFRYRGNRNDPSSPSIGDEFLPYDANEISAILSIFSDVKVVGNRAYGSIKDLTDEAIDDMANLVSDLHDSQVFHQTGPSTELLTDLTIFEQMMVKMFKDTGMADLSYDSTRLADAPFGNANTKAEFLVLNFSTLFPENNLTHMTDRWVDSNGDVGEITAFFRIFKELKVALPDVGSAASIDAGSLSPDSINRIMSVLNYSSLTSDAVKKMVKDAFASISFGTYTENNETYELTPIEFLEEDLTVMNYATLPGIPTQEGLIGGLLSSFYDESTDAYISISGGFNVSTFLAGGGSLYPLVNLLSHSNIFGNEATKILNPNAIDTGAIAFDVTIPGSFKTRALTFYNFLDTASVGKYFDYLTTSTSDKELKVVRVENIFGGDFDEVYESSRLDSFIGTISGFTNLSDASNLDAYSSEMRSLIELTYTATGYTITDRAFMVSELSAGFFTDIFKGEYAIVEDVNAPYFGDASNLALRVNFYDKDHDNTTDFDILNPIEADGLEGALEFLGAIKSVSGTPSPTDINAMKAALVKMGSRINVGVTGGPYPVTTDYTNWSTVQMSQVAQLFYGARVVTNSGFDSLASLIYSVTTPNPANPSVIQTTLTQEPYSSNFVFEIEGEKIGYAFGV